MVAPCLGWPAVGCSGGPRKDAVTHAGPAAPAGMERWGAPGRVPPAALPRVSGGLCPCRENRVALGSGGRKRRKRVTTGQNQDCRSRVHITRPHTVLQLCRKSAYECDVILVVVAGKATFFAWEFVPRSSLTRCRCTVLGCHFTRVCCSPAQSSAHAAQAGESAAGGRGRARRQPPEGHLLLAIFCVGFYQLLLSLYITRREGKKENPKTCLA